MHQVSIVVPCFNEEAVLPETARRLELLLRHLQSVGKVTTTSQVYFVDDGSYDSTWQLIESHAANSELIRGIKLSRNRGHQIALLAGLETVPGDAAISVDADLQDDLAAIEQMIDAFNSGTEIVYGVRKSRSVDSIFKRLSAEGYYKVLSLLGVEVIFNHADYRLMSRRSLDALAQFREANIFLRGLLPQLGFSWSIVYYDRAERYAGESKYPLRKMLALAWNGVTSFSAAPLRFITGLGILVSLVSIAVAVWALAMRVFTSQAVPGWASTVVPIYFLGGIQLFAVGIIGEYLAKIYLETKRRPRYFIDKVV
ncbi:MAG: glycosyltransferase family 2 protein [Steroidobacteraceae bacterium]